MRNLLTGRRRRNEDGMIGVMAMGVMLLLAATSLAVFSAAAVSIERSRDGRAFTEARQNLDYAFADMLWEMNEGAFKDNPSHPMLVAATAGKGGERGVGSDQGRGWWQWQVSTWDDRFGGVIEATACVGNVDQGVSLADCTDRGGLVQTKKLPVRFSRVGSVIPDTDGNTYGMAPLSVWKYAIASAGSATIAGQRSDGVYGALGDGTVDSSTGLVFDTFVTHNPDAEVDPGPNGSSATVIRSSLSAYLDREILDEKIDSCTTWVDYDDSDLNSSPGPLRDYRSGVCYSSVNIARYQPAVLGPATDPAEVVVRGSIAIGQDVAGPLAGLHLFVGGDVTFAAKINPWLDYNTGTYVCDTPNPGDRCNNPPQWRDQNASPTQPRNVTAWIYAPGGKCSTPLANGANGSFNFTGALACDEIDMAGDFTYLAPTPATDSGRVIYYTERPGYTGDTP